MQVEKDHLITLGAIVAVAALFVLIGWMPLRAKEARLASERMNLQVQLAEEQKKTIGLGQLARDVELLRSDAARTRKHVPRLDEQAGLLHKLSTELRLQNVQDQTIQTQAILEGDDFRVMPVRLTFRGSFLSTYLFIHRIEAMEQAVQVSRLEVEGDPSKPDQMLSVVVDLHAFFAAHDQGAGL